MVHYVICQHGLLGTRLDFKHFESHFATSEVKIVILSRNSSPTRTLDGIEAAGTRCAEEIIEFLNTLHDPPVEKLVSVLGHSMGGLILRFALRKIEIECLSVWKDNNIRKGVAIFLATPHVGISASSWVVYMSSQYVLRHLSRTASDLTFHSRVLEDLCDEDGIKSLNAFERVILIANSRGDRLVSPGSALVVGSLDCEIMKQSNEVTITEYSPTPQDVSRGDMKPEQQRIIESLNRKLTNVTRYLAFFPAAYPSFLARFDNTAHTKIICHGILDRSRMGFPIIEHVAELLNSLI